MTRISLAFSLSLSVLAAACGGDDEQPPADAHVNPDAPPGGPDASTIDVVPGTPDADTTDAPPGAPDADTGASPVITQVTWTTPPGCTAGTSSVFTVITTATDADTPTPMLTYSGSIPGCSGVIDMATDSVTCPNFAPYSGTITVTDPEGHSDGQMITISPCANGMAP